MILCFINEIKIKINCVRKNIQDIIAILLYLVSEFLLRFVTRHVLYFTFSLKCLIHQLCQHPLILEWGCVVCMGAEIHTVVVVVGSSSVVGSSGRCTL